MASLRRKPTPDIAAESADPVADLGTNYAEPVAIDTDPAPSPEPVAPHQFDNASHALKQQLADLRQSEMTAATERRRQQWYNQNTLAQEHRDSLGELHRDALDSGLIDMSPQYESYMNHRLTTLRSQHPAAAASHLVDEMQARAAQDREPEPPQPRQRTPMVSAPVSREAPSSYGGSGNSPNRIRLTREQSEFARLSGVSESEYAKQLIKLDEMKRNGDYAERR
jgi:hypothetical protein